MGCREYYESFTLPDGTVVPGGGGDVRDGNSVVPSTGQQPEHAESETIQEVIADSARSDEAQGEPRKPPKKTVGELSVPCACICAYSTSHFLEFPWSRVGLHAEKIPKLF